MLNFKDFKDWFNCLLVRWILLKLCMKGLNSIVIGGKYVRIIHCVSPIKASLISRWFFDFKLKPIFSNTPAATKNEVCFRSVQTWLRINHLAIKDQNLWKSLFVKLDFYCKDFCNAVEAEKYADISWGPPVKNLNWLGKHFSNYVLICLFLEFLTKSKFLLFFSSRCKYFNYYKEEILRIKTI